MLTGLAHCPASQTCGYVTLVALPCVRWTLFEQKRQAQHAYSVVLSTQRVYTISVASRDKHLDVSTSLKVHTTKHEIWTSTTQTQQQVREHDSTTRSFGCLLGGCCKPGQSPTSSRQVLTKEERYIAPSTPFIQDRQLITLTVMEEMASFRSNVTKISSCDD